MRLGLRAELVGCYVLVEDRGRAASRLHPRAPNFVRLDSTLRTYEWPAEAPDSLRAAALISRELTTYRFRGDPPQPLDLSSWSADSLSDTVSVGLSDGFWGIVLLLVGSDADTLTGTAWSFTDTELHLTSLGPIVARRVSCDLLVGRE